jgi:HAD superfamily hydrolase (TIGR01484 family)
LDGRLIPAAYQALADARDAGLAVIPVTGRPAGWVDHIARMWPVDGVVGENGGLWFWMGGGRLRRGFVQSDVERARNRALLDTIAGEILAEVPGTALASDQAYRALDLAVDFCEDVPPLDDTAVDAIVAAFTRRGATCKVSSIHVNGWFGTFDKLTGFGHLCRALGLDEHARAWAFVGDSANDAPMFAHFPVSIGVANVDAFLSRIEVWPAFRAPSPGGFGFTEAVRRILALRG